jgi:hypothetical protein
MNYSNYQMTQVHYQTFIKNMEKEHAGLNWASVQKEINGAMKGKCSPPLFQLMPWQRLTHYLATVSRCTESGMLAATATGHERGNAVQAVCSIRVRRDAD